MIPYSLVKGYLYHWLHAVDKHSLHAPFVYRFYTELVKQDQHEQIFKEIENFRSIFLKDKNTITVKSPGAQSRVSQNNRRQVSSIASYSLGDAKFCRLLYRLISDQKPNIIIELGASLGITTLYLSAANPSATIYTFEGCPETAHLARKLFKTWKIKNIHLIEGNIDDTLPLILSECDSVDFAYMDANHRYQPTLNYYEWLKEKSHERSIFVLDDIYWSSGMQKAWKELYKQAEVRLSLDIFDAGLLFFTPLKKKQHYLLSF
ncbi:putative O-methyltransferase YrrM [Catalinimonas alkaloidigena]|uniref:O-methyltransferase n=1 Tax=Catalinimonas alkaloidigena TaxID=1075417 RepID=UPI0024056B83|nr:class I SAM-dependent methyltransferase [Catalinimonas alkaloidigena]MDF9796725.1 putative O-methyltransferase YrrM [Catalinimonas alkaloidigena]